MATSLTSTGITFPDATTQTTALDYEEGTWTVEFHDYAGASGNKSTTTVTGFYVKTGKQVVAQFYVGDISTSGMTSGNYIFTTLPMASGTSGVDSPLLISGTCATGVITFPNSATQIVWETSASASKANFMIVKSGAAWDFIRVQNFTSGQADVMATIVYFTA